MAETAPRPGIEIRPLESVEEVFRASDVLAEVWGGDRAGMPPNLLRALAHSGNYAASWSPRSGESGERTMSHGEPVELSPQELWELTQQHAPKHPHKTR